ncbi:MAG: hypothetical protein IT336_09345 [Thermomicrobiales bacterium]|nr:hypothetical protein [Thermomicrobiales bacterium]
MRSPNPAKVVVGAHDSIPDVLSRLRAATGGNATLAIPAASSLFLTASEFRALKATVDQSRITLTVETDDRLRKQLATMFKIQVVDLLPGAVTSLEQPPPPVKAEEPSKLPSVLPDLPKIELPPAQEVAPKWEPREAEDAEAGGNEPPIDRHKRRLPVSGRSLGIGTGVVAFVVLLAIVAAYVFQSATVTIVVQRQQVTAELTYAVVSPGVDSPEGAAFTIEAAPITLDVPYRETIQVTGELREPDQIATGTVALRNPTNAPIELAEGATFTAFDGVEYVFVAAVTVPAADASGAAGRADGQIRGALGGESANREIGMLTGRLENGVYYSNRNAAVTGGTDKITRVVAQEDIDRLVANANAQLPQRIVNTPLDDGRVVLPSSVKAGELAYTTDHQVGDVGDSVTIDANMEVSAMAFAPSDVIDRGAGELELSLEEQTPLGHELEFASISYLDPVLVNDRGDAALFELTANANVRPVLDETQRDTIIDEIAGKEIDDAETYVRSLPFVESVEITSSPGFLPARIPGSGGKIEIETR